MALWILLMQIVHIYLKEIIQKDWRNYASCNYSMIGQPSHSGDPQFLKKLVFRFNLSTTWRYRFLY